MENERLAKLFSMELIDNQDPLIKYMIALELKKNTDSRCQDYFLLLFHDFPSFLANYYIAGEYFYTQGMYVQSHAILSKGLEIALNQNNSKAHSEIKNLLMNVEIEL